MSIFHALTDWGGKAVMLSLSLLLAAVHTDCDPEHPDTAANRDAFRTFTGIVPGKTVTGVYFLADEGFVDEAYWLAFRAPPEIIEKIIRKYDLKKCPDGGYRGLDADYHWWSKAERTKGILYQNTLEDEAGNIKENRALWYNAKTGKAQLSITRL